MSSSSPSTVHDLTTTWSLSASRRTRWLTPLADETRILPLPQERIPPMKVKTKIKAGALTLNHNEKLVAAKKPASKAKGLKVKSAIKAGPDGVKLNHNEKLVRAR
jgi:hypothetical protein